MREDEASFQGYRRADGRVGVRNHLLVLSAGGLTARTAQRIAASVADSVVVTLTHGAGLLGKDETLYRHAIVEFAAHPNVGASLIVGDNPKIVAGCVESLKRRGAKVEALTLDDCGHDALALTDRGIRAAARLAMAISGASREAMPVSALTIGLECGRSDPSSGLVANPLLGRVSDWLVEAGGRAILGETIEWLGAEHLLARRARTKDIAEEIVGAVLARERMAVTAGVDLTGSNPGPTNIAAGLSTIEEKSLGNIAKSGSKPVEGVLAYGHAPRGPGLWCMDAAAYAPESVTGFVLAGAQIVLFTTGVGNAYASALAPTLKLCANPRACEAPGAMFDFDASAAFQGGQTPEAAAAALRRRLLDVASGRATWGEVLREGDEVLSRYGDAL